MIDIRLLRSDTDSVIAGLSRRGVSRREIDELIESDSEALRLVKSRDDARSRLRDLSRQVAEARRSNDDALASSLQAQSRSVSEEVDEADKAAAAAEQDRLARLLVLPNLPSSDAPDGSSSEDNRVVTSWRPPRLEAYASHQRIPHWEVGRELGVLDLEAGAKLSGSMFPLFKGKGASLLRALTSFAIDRHSDAFIEVRPPTLVRGATMVSTGHLPKFGDDAYHVERDELWAIPTAEVPLTAMRKDEILEEASLPQRMTASTSCFRREAGAAGRDTRGVLRVHEFDKVELVAYCTPAQALEVHADMLQRAEALLRELELEYRVLDLCAGDLGAASARTFDIEVYAPGCEQWLEVSSVSWCSDYQARRANIRYRPTGGGSLAYVHTLNGSALAWPRVWAALMEAKRREDGTVGIPACLSAWMGGATAIGTPNDSAS